MTSHRLGLMLVVALLPAASLLVAPPPSLHDVLRRAGEYAVRYGETMTSVVAEEAYDQQVVAASGSVLETRTLISVIAFVRLTGSTDWLAFRDVQRVDGREIASDPARLQRLLEGAGSNAIAQAQALATASAQFNLGPLRRTFNTPTITLQFLHPAHQDRFDFKRTAIAPCGSDTCWTLSVRERRDHTLIRTAEGRDIPLTATLRVVPDDGRLVSGSFELRRFLGGSKRDTSHARIDVVWQPDEHIGEWVPAEMHERYDGVPDPASPTEPRTIVGTARYTNFRRFTTDVRIR